MGGACACRKQVSVTQQPTMVVNLPVMRPKLQTPGRLGKFPSGAGSPPRPCRAVQERFTCDCGHILRRSEWWRAEHSTGRRSTVYLPPAPVPLANGKLDGV